MSPTEPNKLNGSKLLTLKAGADYTGLSVWTLRECVWAGLLPYVQLPGGRKLWVHRVDLDRLIQSNTRRHE